MQLVQFDSGGQKCASSTLVVSFELHAVTDVLLARIRERQVTMGSKGDLECAVLLNHGRLMPLLISEHATYGVEQLRHFMAAPQDEFSAAHVRYDRVLAEWAGLKAHMVKDFANVRMSKMWEAVVHDKAHAYWVALRLVEVCIVGHVHVHPCQR